MRLTTWMTAGLLAWAAGGPANAAMLPAVADAEVGERPGEDRGNGTSDQMNARFFVDGDRNEMLAMRFDTTGIDFNDFAAATLNLVHFRDNSDTRTFMLYGVNDGATGGDNNGETPGYDDNDWDEGSVVMSTMPGLTYDGDAATPGINGSDTTLLGTADFSSAVKGDVEVIDVAGLYSFLDSHPDDQVTLLLARDPAGTSTGQDRFATREAVALDGGSPTGSAGAFAPYLNLVVPEPATAMLLAICCLGLAGSRRRGW